MEDDFSQLLRIPKDRVGVLVGKNGEVKRLIEKETERVDFLLKNPTD